MMDAIFSLFLWLPGPLVPIVSGVLVIFFIWSLLCLIRIIWDVLPFV